MDSYSQDYYRSLKDGSRRSAELIVPFVTELVDPQSVVDVGCGTGTWLCVFGAAGIRDLYGIDRPELRSGLLDIPPERFHGHDLGTELTLDRVFDLVVSVEVAEHLPEGAAEQYVTSLTRLGPVVLFSAAVPHQGGEHHVNEQWPGYWVDLFSAKGYRAIDCLRQRIWEAGAVDWWYAQNLLLFVEEAHLARWPRLRAAAESAPPTPLSLIHPAHYLDVHWRNRVLRAAIDLVDTIPRDRRFVVIDQDQFGVIPLPGGRRSIPFSANQRYFDGPPPNDVAAVETLETLRSDGASYCVLGWPAFWWLKHYAGFARHLRSRYACVLETPDLLIFDLTAAASAVNAC